jgi:macrolide transport system ATP-binding/permease protein
MCGTGAALPQIQTWPLAQGGFFTQEDEREMATVAAGAAPGAQADARHRQPCGQNILIGNVPFQVIGVMSEKGALTGDKDVGRRAAAAVFHGRHPRLRPARADLYRAGGR